MPLPHQKPAFGSRHPPKWHFQCSSSQGCCEVPPLRTVTGKQLEGWDALQDRRVHAVRRLPGLGGPLPRGLGSRVETRAVPLVALPLISSVVSLMAECTCRGALREGPRCCPHPSNPAPKLPSVAALSGGLRWCVSSGGGNCPQTCEVTGYGRDIRDAPPRSF